MANFFGNLFGGGSQTTNSTTNTSPWDPQQSYIQDAFGGAKNAYDAANSRGPFTGNYVAGPNAYQSGAENQAATANSNLGWLPGTVGATSGALMGAGTSAVNNATGIAANGIGGPDAGLYGTLHDYGTGAQKTPGMDPALSSALGSAAINGANSLNGFTSGLQGIGQMATSDPTARIAGDAAQYANNPGVQASINSTNANIAQVLNEQTLPQMNAGAAAQGNVNSSRTGMEEGMAREGAGIATGNADASILNNVYNTGMGTAAGLYSSGLNTGASANTSGLYGAGANTNAEANRQVGQNEFNTNTQLGAANSGLGTNLSYGLGDVNARLGANGQLGNLTGLGVGAASAAPGIAANNVNLLSGAGALQQAGEQAGNTNALDQFQGNYQYPWQNLDNYFNVVGRPMGQTAQTNGTLANSGPGVVGGILGLGAGAAGLFGANGAFPGALSSLGDLFSGGSSSPTASAAQLGAWNPFTNGGY